MSGDETKTILVVEDDFFIAMNLEDTLIEEGFAVVGPAHSLAECSDCLSQEIAGAVLDLNLGGGETTEELAATLQERGVKCVFHTGNPETPGLHESHPDIPVVCKGGSVSEIVATLRQIL